MTTVAEKIQAAVNATAAATVAAEGRVMDAIAERDTRIDTLEQRIAVLEGGQPPPPGPDPAWAVALRAAFTGITYTDFAFPPTITTSQSLNLWLAGVPNGAGPKQHSRIIFPPTFTLSGGNGINLADKRNLTIDGTGCALLNRCTPNSLFSYSFYLLRCTNVTVRGFSVDGNNATTATPGVVAQEALSAAAIAAGCSFIEFSGVSWDRLYGFGPLICSNEGTVWPSDVWLHDCTIRGGEMGVGVTAGRRLLIERNTVKDSQYTAFDLEPDASQAQGGGFEDVLIQDNPVDTYGWHAASSNWLLATVPQPAVESICTMNRLIFRRQNVSRGPADPAKNGSYPGQGGLGIRANATNIKNDYVITDNQTTHASTLVAGGGRAVMKLDNIHGLTVTGNRQPLSTAAPLLQLGAGNTNAVTTPNP